MKHELMTLPYALDALEPLMSKETLEFHYGKHHQTYVNNLNNLITGTKFENSTLVEIILESDGGLFNNSAQVYNHDFFWKGLTPTQGEIPSKVEEVLCKTFGSVEKFKEEQYKEAIEILEKAVLESPDDYEIYYYLGWYNHYLAYDDNYISSSDDDLWFDDDFEFDDDNFFDDDYEDF